MAKTSKRKSKPKGSTASKHKGKAVGSRTKRPSNRKASAHARRVAAALKGWQTRRRNQAAEAKHRQQGQRKRQQKRRHKRARKLRELRDYLVFVRFRTTERKGARIYTRDVIIPAPRGTPLYKIKRVASDVLRDYITAHAGREPRILSIKSEKDAQKGSPIIAEAIEVAEGPKTKRKKPEVR